MPSHRQIIITMVSIVVVIVSAVSIYHFGTQPIRHNPRPTPVPLYEYNFTELNPQVTELLGYNYFAPANVSQGLTLEINMTFTSIANEPMKIPIENMTLTYYSSTVSLGFISTSNNYSSIQQQAFNYSFSQKELTMQPGMSNSTLLTINLAQNAPTGQYTLEISVGQVQAVNAIPYAAEIGFEMIVTPKTT